MSVPVCAALVQGSTRRYKEVPSGTKEVQGSTDRYVLLCSDLFAEPGFAFLLDSLLQCCPAGSSVFKINASTSTIMIYLTLGPVCPSALGSFVPFALGERNRALAAQGSRGQPPRLPPRRAGAAPASFFSGADAVCAVGCVCCLGLELASQGLGHWTTSNTCFLQDARREL